MATQNAKNNKKKKRVYETDNVKIGRIVARMFFFLMLILLPLYMDSQMYLALINAKSVCGLFIYAITGLGILFYYVQGFTSGEYKIYGKFDRFKPLDFIAVGFGIVLVIATLMSDDVSACLMGTNGFHIGALAYGCLLLAYFFVSRHVKSTKDIWDMVLIVNSIICVWLFLNTCSIDILNMHAEILETQYYQYSASLGNVDSVSAYLSMFLPIVLVFYLNEDNKSKRQFYMGNLICTMLGVLGNHSDGLTIGIFFLSILFVPYMLKSNERIERTFFALAVMGGLMTIYKILNVVVPDNKVYLSTDMINKLVGKWVGIPMLVVFGVLYFLMHRRKNDLKLTVISKLGVAYSIVASLGFVGAVIYVLTHLTASFGTGRGAIWMGAWDFFKSLTIRQKITGVGPVMLRDKMSQYVYNNGGDTSLAFATCHNGILETLLGFGIVGLVLAILMWVFLVKGFFKNINVWSVERVAYLLALAGYLGQSMVGNPYSLSVPIFITIIMLYRNQQWLEQKEELAEKE